MKKLSILFTITSIGGSKCHRRVLICICVVDNLCQSFTCSAVGLVSASFCRQASTNEQNSGEKLCFDGDGDGSSKIFHKNIKVLQNKNIAGQSINYFPYNSKQLTDLVNENNNHLQHQIDRAFISCIWKFSCATLKKSKTKAPDISRVRVALISNSLR